METLIALLILLIFAAATVCVFPTPQQAKFPACKVGPPRVVLKQPRHPP